MFKSGIQKRLIISSVAFFIVIAALVIGIFRIVIVQSEQEQAKQQALSVAKEKKQSLSYSVDREIFLSTVMAESPLIKQYFLNPGNEELKELFFAEMEAYRNAFKDNIVFWVSDADKRFYYNGEFSYVVDPDNPDSYWYEMTLYETEEYNLNINYNPELDTINLWVNAPVFYEGEPVGMLGTGVNLTNFVNEFFSNTSGQVETVFFNEKGEITGHKDKSLISEKVDIYEYYPDIEQQIKNAVSGADAWEEENPFTFTQKGGRYTGNVLKIKDINWYILTYTVNHLQTEGDLTTIILIGLLVIIFIVFVVFNLIVRGAVLKPIGKIREALGVVAEGDLTATTDIHRNDELGELSRYIEKIGSGLTELIRGIRDGISEVDKLGESLKENAEQTTEIVRENVINLEGIRKDVDSQTENVEQTSSTIEQLTRNIEMLNNSISSQTSSIEESSAAMEQVIANVTSITKMNSKAEEKVASLEESSGVGLTNIKQVTELVGNIADQSENLLEANDLIAGIAAQTNLLAMNAAIEAAHAGDYGRGFAVVADEIRKLAEQSTSQSKEVASSIKNIQLSIEEVVTVSDKTSGSFAQIQNEISEVSNAFTEVKKAIEEQSAGGQQILTSLSEMRDITNEVQSGSKEMQEGNSVMLNAVSSFRESTQAIEQAVEHVSTGGERIRTAMDSISSMTVENKRHLEKITKEVDRFVLADE